MLKPLSLATVLLGLTVPTTLRAEAMAGGFEALAPLVDAVNGGHFVRLERVAQGLPPADQGPG